MGMQIRRMGIMDFAQSASEFEQWLGQGDRGRPMVWLGQGDRGRPMVWLGQGDRGRPMVWLGQGDRGRPMVRLGQVDPRRPVHCAWSKGTSKQRGRQRAHKNHYYVWGGYMKKERLKCQEDPQALKPKSKAKIDHTNVSRVSTQPIGS